MAAVVGALRIDLSASVAQFAEDLSSAGKHLEGFAAKFRTVAKDVMRLGETMSVAISLPLIEFGREASKIAIESKQAIGQVDAALRSMGNTSGRSAEQLEKTAGALARTSTFVKDDILRNVTAGLLRFGNIQGPIFDRAEKATVNLASRMKTDLPSATTLVGKALNDPIKGLTALSRAGVQFTQSEKDHIKGLVIAGKGYQAQGVILDQLDRQFGGASQAMRDATPTAGLHQAWHDFSEQIGKVVNEFLPPLTAFLERLVGVLDSLSPSTLRLVVVGAALLAILGPLLVYFGAVLEAAVVVTEALSGLAEAFAGLVEGGGLLGTAIAVIGANLLPFIAIVVALGAFIWAFRDKFVSAFKDVYDSAVATLGPPIQSVVAAFKDVLDTVMNGPLGEGIAATLSLLADFAAAVIRAFGSQVVQMVAGFLNGVATGLHILGDILKVNSDLLKGDWSKAWTDAGNVVIDVIAGILRTMNLIFPGLDKLADRLERLRGGDAKSPKSAAPAAPGAPPPPPGLPPLVPPKFNLGTTTHKKDATKTLGDELRKLDTQIGLDLGGINLPEATKKADALRAKLAELIQTAKEAGAKTHQFAAQIDALRGKIATLETAMLAKEAEKFGREVAADARDVDKLAKGSLPPLSEALQKVDDDYQALRDKILAEIEANKVLADKNKEAAAAMAVLQAQLGRLEGAHAAATKAAEAQYAAEERIAGLQSAEFNLSARTAIRDFKQSSGRDNAPLSSGASELQKIQDDLDKRRLDSELQLAELQKSYEAAVRSGYDEEATRLKSNIDLERQYHDLVAKTSAMQIQAAERTNAAFQSFTDGLTNSLLDIGKKGANVFQDLRTAFSKLAEDEFMRPGAEAIASTISGGLRSLLGAVVPGAMGKDATSNDPTTNALKGIFGSGKRPTGAAGDPIFVVAAGGSAGGGGLGGMLSGLLGGGSGAGGLLGGAGDGIGNLFGDAFGAGGAGASGPAIDVMSSFLGGFAGGGRMRSGGWGIVGEDGPEIFAPSRSGYVVPSDQAFGRGSGGVTQIFNVQTPDAASFGYSQRQIARRAKKHLDTVGG